MRLPVEMNLSTQRAIRRADLAALFDVSQAKIKKLPARFIAQLQQCKSDEARRLLLAGVGDHRKARP